MAPVNHPKLRRFILSLVIAAISVTVAMTLASASGKKNTNEQHSRSGVDCGLPRPDLSLKEAALPDVARLRGVEITALDTSRGFVSADLNVPLSVEELLNSLLSRTRSAGYDVLYEDFEGFEAELYVSSEGRPGTVRMVTSECADFSRLMIHLPTEP